MACTGVSQWQQAKTDLHILKVYNSEFPKEASACASAISSTTSGKERSAASITLNTEYIIGSYEKMLLFFSLHPQKLQNVFQTFNH